MPTIPDDLNTAVHHYQACRLPEAESLCRQILQVQPSHPDALHILGLIAHRVGRNDVAVELIGKAITANPTVAEYHNNIGEAYRALGLSEEARVCYQQALTLMPAYAEACNNLGVVFHSQGKLEEAVAYYRQALLLKPEYEQPYVNLGRAQSEQGKVEEAVASYQRALVVKPNDGVRLLMATVLPVIAESRDHLIEARRRFMEQVSGLAHENLSIGDPAKEIGTTNFYLAYQGLDVREIQQAMSRLYERACPSLNYCAPHCRPSLAPAADRAIKIGFLSRMVGNHTITSVLMRGVIANLPRERFSVNVFTFHHERNVERGAIAQCADRVVVLPSVLEAARDHLANEQLDILCYVDLGMDPLTYFLAFSRLAPVQCATWQHPVTTGIPTIDYFLSGESLEPAQADGHYSERLVRLGTLPTFYYRPAKPARAKSRKELGLEEGCTLYLCPQSVYKLHPDFDEVIAGILKADARGVVVFIEGAQKTWTELLMCRFRNVMPMLVGRIRVLPRLAGEDFMQLLAVADVMLDPLHWSGGVTTLDALAMGTPVVTLPGEFMRGRVTYACYTQMGVMDCVADSVEDYIARAVHLGRDAAYRAEIVSKILASNAVLYENAEAPRAFARFFMDAHRSACERAGKHRDAAIIWQRAGQEYQAGRLQEAGMLCEEVLQFQPDHPGAHLLLGNLAQTGGRLDGAEAHYRQVLRTNPDSVEACNNLGVVLQAQGKLEAAVACYQQALILQPTYADVHHNLGNVLQEQGKLEAAVACYQQALILKPTYAEVHNNLGNVLEEQGKLEAAVLCYRQALALKPSYAMAHWNLALALLHAGSFEQGFREYEWRWQAEKFLKRNARVVRSQPFWDGSDFRKKTLLLFAEQGYGDTIQFIRYVPLVAKRGGRVIVACQPELVSLLASVSGIAQVLNDKERLADFDIHAPLLSLPLAFATTLDTVPAQIPYIIADRSRVEVWRERLRTNRKTLNVGVAWAGHPLFMNDHNRKRSCPFSMFASLAKVRNVNFYSLQKGEAEKVASEPPEGMAFIDMTAFLNDFADTAALINNLDLVISIDTAVAHLAGAMGKPVWTLLPYVPDWRWLSDRDDSPWYPTMRLFRQERPGDWPGVFARVAGELSLFVGETK